MMQVYGFYVLLYYIARNSAANYIARNSAANYISFKVSVEGGTLKY